MTATGATLLPFLVLLSVTDAFAHDSWISRNRITDPATGEWCCNHLDCRPEKVTAVEGGYKTEYGDVVPHRRVIWKSPDGHWWRCRHLGGATPGATRCLIGSPPGA